FEGEGRSAARDDHRWRGFTWRGGGHQSLGEIPRPARKPRLGDADFGQTDPRGRAVAGRIRSRLARRTGGTGCDLSLRGRTEIWIRYERARAVLSRIARTHGESTARRTIAATDVGETL